MIALAGAAAVGFGLVAAVARGGGGETATAEAPRPAAAAAPVDREREARARDLAELERRKQARETELADAERRLGDLQKRRAELQSEIAELVAPVSPPSGDAAIADEPGPDAVPTPGTDAAAAEPDVQETALAEGLAAADPIPTPPERPKLVALRSAPEPVRSEVAVDEDVPPVAASRGDATAGEPVRVFIHVRASDRAARARALALAEELKRRGVTVAQIRGVPHAVRRDALRYFYDADRASLSTLEAALRDASADGAPPVAQDFRNYRAPPRRGTLEIWLS